MENQCERCYTLFLPFVGETSARLGAAHAPCSEPPVPRFPSELVSVPEPVLAPVPAPRPTASRKERRREMSRFGKRHKTLLFKADDLHLDCDAEVYLAVRKNNKLYTYSSNESFPPSRAEIMKSYPLPQAFNPMRLRELRARRRRKGAGVGQGNKASI